MLTTNEIKEFIEQDKNDSIKINARIGRRYYEGDHDIKRYRMFYFDNEGKLHEDTTRANVKNCHAFFTELTDQCVQYILSGSDGIFRSDKPELQNKLDEYFNDNEDFMAELSDLITASSAEGSGFLYAYKNKDNKLSFQCADYLGVIEARGKDTSDGNDYYIYYYVERLEKGKKKVVKIQVWDKLQTYYYVMDNGTIEEDKSVENNPRPHIIQKENDVVTKEGLGYIPFFRLDNNKKRVSDLNIIKDLIDDYDIMASSLSNNLIDFDNPIHLVKGFEGDNLDELQTNLKTKKLIGVSEEGGIEIKTVEIPYQARQAKLDLDEKNIYRFGFGLNMSGLKDTSATTNIAIKAAYSLLDLKAGKKEIKLKQLFRKILKPVLEEINKEKDTDYQQNDVYFVFAHEIMSNAKENADIDLVRAQEKQVMVNLLLSLCSTIDDDTIIQNICDVLEINYEEIQRKLPKKDEEEAGIEDAANLLKKVKADESETEGSTGSASEE